MSERSKFFQGGVRAVTGLGITAAAAAGVLLITTVDLPTVERAPHAITVDTQQSGVRDLVCSGPFAELGADPERPDIAVPVGEASVVVAGDGELTTLEAREGDENSVSGARVLSAPTESAIGAAQLQSLDSPTLAGLVAANCSEPLNEQWLVGGGTSLGEWTTLSLSNTSDVPATVQIAVFDDTGEISSFQTAGVIVAPDSQQIISLNGYAPERSALAVRITSTGAPVAASLGVSRSEGIRPVGASSVDRQLRPETRLVIPGVANVDDDSRGDRPTHSAEPEDRFPVRVQAIAPGDAAGTANVIAVDAKGAQTPLGSIELAPRKVGALDVTAWPEDATAIIIDSDVPIYAGAMGTSNIETGVDFDWFSPAPQLDAGTEVATPIVSGGGLVIVNPGAEEAEVTIEGSETRTVDVPAGASVAVKASGTPTVSSDQPIHLGVRVLSKGVLAAYSIEPPAARGGEFTIYTR